MKRLTMLLPLAVFAALVCGFLAARVARARQTLPWFAPAQPPQLGELNAPFGDARIAGRVLDPDGAGLADVSVYLRCASVPHWTTTDGEGRFALEGLVEGEHEVILLAWGRAPARVKARTGDVEFVLPPIAPPPEPLPALETAPLVGRLAHPLRNTWQSVEGYELVLAPLEAPMRVGTTIERRLRVEPRGLFALDDLALGSYAIKLVPGWAAGSDWPDLAQPSYARVHHGKDSGGLVVPLAAGALDVRVSGADGLPLEGALALLSPTANPARVWPPQSSDAEGRLRFVDLPPGDYEVVVRAGEAEARLGVEIESGRVSAVETGPLAIRRR
ncbi:MAG: carboxypeptidase regulatory-like domain-containing protein [Planctomycetes bacterium]|nr:carboxypeptidase regulatory-like domain-containing protein [Planctomycetota bacterium]